MILSGNNIMIDKKQLKKILNKKELQVLTCVKLSLRLIDTEDIQTIISRSLL